MIKKFLDKLLGKPAASTSGPPLGKRLEIGPAEHGINLSLLDDRAVKVVQTLADAGYEAYIVGGAVRDLLLGLRPKDFDVATNATPEQVKSLFRRAFIIGRRFRIVHVVFGRGREHEVIEVSTFRAVMDPAAAEQVDGNEKNFKRGADVSTTRVVDAAGRVLRDNVWGPQIEDAARRDFTVNALYFDPQRQIVVDYHGGLKDARRKLLRMIGDPATRYREDPVRIIRVVRFAAKLGFEIEPKTRAPIREMAALLASVPPSRLFDEMFKLLQTGHSLASLAELRKQGLHQGVFPLLDAVLSDAPQQAARRRFVELALADTDRRVGEGKPVAPSFLLACLLWHDVLQGWDRLKAAGEAPHPALQQAIDAVFDARVGEISGRGKLGADMREIWLMQPRFERRVGNGPLSLIEQPRFRAGFDFLRLRADAGEGDAGLAEWWEDFSQEDDDARRALIEDLRKQQPKRARRPADPGQAVDGNGADVPHAEEAAAPERKRRRRRRKPATAASEGGATAARPADNSAG
ncbi:polynucleotide adenylyltransferase PcnB [Piscinibacter sakaiensis]|uniref:polynucleotide adenylyltransferase PcnB n=1 Tax=Piscinibacter sakaiensis TaxID=1547922 RepID=UPI003AAAA850